MSAQRSSRFENGEQVVVMKFGGTSVEDAVAVRRLIEIVQSRGSSRPVVVVSALAGVTDQLLQAGRDAANRRLGSALAAVHDIYVRHESIADEFVYGESYRELNGELRSEFRALETLLLELDQSRALIPQCKDQLLGFGESLSSVLVNAALRAAGVLAEHVDARACILTDTRYGQATPLWDATNLRIQECVGPLLDSGCVPVMGGFIAATANGIPTTLGRGGSDFTAAIVGAALFASRMEIWTDVAGVMTADPRLCPEAVVIPRMSFDEAAELAHCGAKVLHPATLAPAARENIPVHVLNSRDPEGSGTEIVAAARRNDSVSAIAAKRHVASVEIESERGLDSEVLRSVSDVFAQHSCPVELLALSQGRLSLLASSSEDLTVIAANLRGIAKMRWEDHKALVSLVGENIRRQPEIASRAFASVADMEVRVVCHGASDRTISFLVEESAVARAVQRLHRIFFPQLDSSQPEVSQSDWGGISSAFCQAGTRQPTGPNEDSAAQLGRL